MFAFICCLPSYSFIMFPIISEKSIIDVTYLQNNTDTLIEHMRMRSSCSRSKCHRSIQISFLLGHSSVETTMVYLDITTEQEMTALATL